MCHINWNAVSAISTFFGTLVVCWYTYEAHRLRLLTSKQVDLLMSAVQPFFHLKSIKLEGRGLFVLTVYNYGGPARNIKVSSDNMEIQIENSILEHGSHQHWNMHKKVDPDTNVFIAFVIDIEYEDSHGLSNRKTFNSSQIEVTEVE